MGASARTFVLLLVLAGVIPISCSGRRVESGAQTLPQPEEQVFHLSDKQLPSKADWLARVIAQPEVELDLIEAATVLANAKLETPRTYSAIPRWLEPYVRRAKRSLPPGADAGQKIEALNKEVLPAVQKQAAGELRWLIDTIGGGEGGCAVFTLLYMIAADSLSLRLEVVCLPNHTLPCYRGEAQQRHIESTHLGEHLSYEGYRKFLSDDPLSYETIAEDTDAVTRHFSPITRRQFVSLLLTQTGGKRGKSDEDLDAAMHLAPDFYYPLKMRAGQYMAKREFAQAGILLSKAIELAPYVPALYVYRAGGRHHESQFALAKSDLDIALKLCPRYGHFYHVRSMMLAEQGRIWEAIDASALAILNGDKVAAFWRYRAYLYERLKKYKEALSDLSQAIILEPRDAATYGSRSKIWAMLGNEKEYEADRKVAETLQKDRR